MDTIAISRICYYLGVFWGRLALASPIIIIIIISSSSCRRRRSISRLYGVALSWANLLLTTPKLIYIYIYRDLTISSSTILLNKTLNFRHALNSTLWKIYVLKTNKGLCETIVGETTVKSQHEAWQATRHGMQIMVSLFGYARSGLKAEHSYIIIITVIIMITIIIIIIIVSITISIIIIDSIMIIIIIISL